MSVEQNNFSCVVLIHNSIDWNTISRTHRKLHDVLLSNVCNGRRQGYMRVNWDGTKAVLNTFIEGSQKVVVLVGEEEPIMGMNNLEAMSLTYDFLIVYQDKVRELRYADCWEELSLLSAFLKRPRLQL